MSSTPFVLPSSCPSILLYNFSIDLAASAVEGTRKAAKLKEAAEVQELHQNKNISHVRFLNKYILCCKALDVESKTVLSHAGEYPPLNVTGDELESARLGTHHI